MVTTERWYVSKGFQRGYSALSRPPSPLGVRRSFRSALHTDLIQPRPLAPAVYALQMSSDDTSSDDSRSLEEARLRIYSLQDGAVRAAALSYCLRNELFEQLEEQPRTYEELLSLAGLEKRVAPTLLAFLCSQKLIARGEDGSFANTTETSTFLVRSSPRYVGARGLLFAGFHEAIGHLETALETGEPWTRSGQHDMFGGFSGDDQEWFAEGMFANAVHGARALLDEVDFGKFWSLLDIGGNAGAYALAIAAEHPRLEATIFDLRAVRALAASKILAAGLGSRVRFVEGSFFTDRLPEAHDCHLLSSILHDWGDDDCRRILNRSFDSIAPGGTVVVTEPMLAEDLTGPDHASVSGLTMAVLGGENRTRSQIGELLESVGFRQISTSPLGLQNSVVTGVHPSH